MASGSRIPSSSPSAVRERVDRRGRLRALDLGREGELAVERLLADDGWTTVARNWRAGGGELDRVVTRGGSVRFVEVKVRASRDTHHEEVWSEAQRRRAYAAAERWLDAHDPSPGSGGDVGFLLVLATQESGAWTFWMVNADP